MFNTILLARNVNTDIFASEIEINSNHKTYWRSKMNSLIVNSLKGALPIAFGIVLGNWLTRKLAVA